MKVAIPTLVNNPTLDSEIAECPISAKSLLIYDTVHETFSSIKVYHPSTEICQNVDKLAEMGVDNFVSGICCQGHFDKFKSFGITVWKCNAVTVRDMINNFKLGGAFLRKWADEITHPATS